MKVISLESISASISRIQKTQIVNTLRNSGVVVCPTETVYGLSALFSDKIAVEKISTIKGRNKHAGFILLVSGIDMLTQFVLPLDNTYKQLISLYWPGPLTILFPVSKEFKKIYSHVLCGCEKIAVRHSNLSLLNEIIDELNEPIVSTSLNRSGESPIVDPKLIPDDFKKQIDFVIDVGKIKNNLPSTIVEVEDDNLKIIRQGSVKFS